ncbi:MAG: cytochrome-c oxidase, cbb3-type subunit III [Pseudomonadota bacterium]
MADNNPFPGENNTGHIWDDNLRELENPPPNWWMIGFWASIAFVVGYGILYPMWPVGEEPTQGVLGWSQIDEYRRGVDEVNAVRAPFEEKLKDLTAKQILENDELTDYTQRSAKVLFGDFCAPCHGGGGQGGPDYPVLVDDDWLFGGAVETIEQTIINGRKGTMTAHANILKPEETEALVKSIMAGKPTEEPLYAAKGCIACHGPDGKGLQVLGAADLTDKIWRFKAADQEQSVRDTIMHGVNFPGDPKSREAIMPNFGERLSKDEIKKLAVYVYKLGGGQ